MKPSAHNINLVSPLLCRYYNNKQPHSLSVPYVNEWNVCLTTVFVEYLLITLAWQFFPAPWFVSNWNSEQWLVTLHNSLIYDERPTHEPILMVEPKPFWHSFYISKLWCQNDQKIKSISLNQLWSTCLQSKVLARCCDHVSNQKKIARHTFTYFATYQLPYGPHKSCTKSFRHLGKFFTSQSHTLVIHILHLPPPITANTSTDITLPKTSISQWNYLSSHLNLLW